MKEKYLEQLKQHSNQAELHIATLKGRRFSLKNHWGIDYWRAYKDGIDRAIELLSYLKEEKNE